MVKILTIVFNLDYQMKIFEKLFQIFLIFAQFIQLDAIVGGYEAERHRHALIKRISSLNGAILDLKLIENTIIGVGGSQVCHQHLILLIKMFECLISISKSTTYSFTEFGLSLLCWIFNQWKLGYYKCKLLQKSDSS